MRETQSISNDIQLSAVHRSALTIAVTSGILTLSVIGIVYLMLGARGGTAGAQIVGIAALLVFPISGAVYGLARHLGQRLASAREARSDALAVAGAPSGVSAVMEERVGAALARAGRQNGSVSVMALAVDQYEECRAGLGDGAASALETEVASQLRRVVRAEEAAIRIGENRFVVVLEHGGGDDIASMVADRIRSHFAGVIELAGERLGVSLSIGVALDKTSFAQAGGLIRSAEVALAEARGLGGDQVVNYRHELDDIAHARATLARDFRKAVRDDEVALVFQPVYAISDLDLVGAEALLRWNHEIHGRLSATFLVRLAGETGVLRDLSVWICEHARAGAIAAGLDAVTVNLSRTQLEDSDIVEAVIASTAQEGPALVFDIAVDVLHSDKALAGVERLHAAGQRLIVDGLGSDPDLTVERLSHPQAVSAAMFAGLKIDVANFPAIAEDRRLQADIWRRLSALRIAGMVIAAKSVETAEQLDRLSGMGVSQVQGNFLCAPVIASTLERLGADGGQFSATAR